MKAKSGVRALAGVVLVLACAGSAVGETKKAKPPTQSENYDDLYARYLSQARTPAPVPDPFGWINGLGFDPRARHVNDLISSERQGDFLVSGCLEADEHMRIAAEYERKAAELGQRPSVLEFAEPMSLRVA